MQEGEKGSSLCRKHRKRQSLFEAQREIFLTTGSKELSKLYSDSGLSGEAFCKGAVHSFRDQLLCGTGDLKESISSVCRGRFPQRSMKPCFDSFSAVIWSPRIPVWQEDFRKRWRPVSAAGVTPVIIGRPLQEEGLSLPEARVFLAKLFGLTLSQKVSLVGIGMGAEKTLTLEGKKAFEEAELLIGAAYDRCRTEAGADGSP